MRGGKNKTVPTSTELELLKVLWKIQPATVKKIHEQIQLRQSVAYTTTLKMLQIMYEKGFVSRDESNRAHIYTAIYSEVQTQSSMVSELLSKVFSGSKFDLVVRALGESASKDEIAEIRTLLDTLEKRKE